MLYSLITYNICTYVTYIGKYTKWRVYYMHEINTYVLVKIFTLLNIISNFLEYFC